MRRYIIVLLSMLAICSVPCQSQTIDRALFERMVAITKHFEGWHDPKTTPGYVGYGHQLQKGERFPKTLTRQRADLLLRTDLLRHLRLYARYGRDALLLSEISDNNSESFPYFRNTFKHRSRSHLKSESACASLRFSVSVSWGSRRCP